MVNITAFFGFVISWTDSSVFCMLGATMAFVIIGPLGVSDRSVPMCVILVLE